MLHKDTKDPMIQKLLAIAKKASSRNLQVKKLLYRKQREFFLEMILFIMMKKRLLIKLK